MDTTEENILTKATAYTAAELYGNDKAEAIIAEIRAEALSFAPDLSTDASRKQIASVAAKVAKAKVAIDAAGKQLVDPIKAKAKVIDAERRAYKDALDALKAEVRQPLTDWEHEQNRITEERKQRLFEIEQAGITTSDTTGEIFPVGRLEKSLAKLTQAAELSEDEMQAKFGELTDKAKHEIQSGLVKVKQAIQTRKVLDQHAEQEVKAKEETPEQRAKREAEIAENAAQAERDRQADEAKRKADEDAKRAADAEHVRKVKNEAYQSLAAALYQNGISPETELLVHILTAIADGKVDHVTMQF